MIGAANCLACGGTGKELCNACVGNCKIRCTSCSGCGRVKFYVKLIVKWKVNKDHFVTGSNGLSDEHLLGKGEKLFEESGASLSNLCNYQCTEKHIILASARLIDKHKHNTSQGKLLHMRHTIHGVPVNSVQYQKK